MHVIHSSPAVVLRWRAYGDSDKIVTFLTRDFGKLTGIGKGARNSRRRFPNSLELIARVRVHFRQRPDASLAFLESCELTAGAAALDAERLAYGAYLAELAEQFTVEWSPAPEIYALLDDAVAALHTGPATASFVRAYELQLLDRAGFAPPLAGCHQCDRQLDGSAAVYFAAAQGLFWCGDCAGSRDGLQAVAAPVMSQLRQLRQTPLDHCRSHLLGDERGAAALLTGQLLALHLHRPLQSIRTIEQLTANRSRLPLH